MSVHKNLVTCSECKKKYMFDVYYGDDCDSLVFEQKTDRYVSSLDIASPDIKKGELYIESGYGSKYDLHVFKFKNPNEWKTKEGNVICDSCIETLLSSKDIILVFNNHLL